MKALLKGIAAGLVAIAVWVLAAVAMLSAALPAPEAHYSVCMDVSDALSMCVSGDKAAVTTAVREMAETLK